MVGEKPMRKATMKANLLRYLFKKNTLQGFTSPAMLLRMFIYGGIFMNLILPFYNYETHSFSSSDKFLYSDFHTTSDAKSNIENMNSAQAYYFLENKAFSYSFQELPLSIEAENNLYSYQILSQMVPVQTLSKEGESASDSGTVVMVAQAKYPRLNSYIGMVSTLKDSNTQKVHLISVVCEVDTNTALPTTMPIVIDGDIQCPKASKKVMGMKQ
jgi:hypothetical protein